MTVVLPLDTADATLETVGGKGLNLARLLRAGFDVPDGFLVTTRAYREFVAAAGLESVIEDAVAGLDSGDAPELATAEASIRAAFVAAGSPGCASEVSTAYEGLGAGVPVAVRSSATAEDLPELSFAGQQDTFLNVIGADSVVTAVVDCWASLWTARAIGYRIRNGIDHAGVALAVVVQRLVDADVSGVLFTADPLSGHRGRTVIDATRGLGEALVSGQVTPDHLAVETRTGAVQEHTVGAKAVATRPRAGGGVTTSATSGKTTPALTDTEIGELVALGKRVQAEYGQPQDIEWAIADGRLYVLQSRAITSLFPVPTTDDGLLGVYFSFGAVQGMLAPMTPMGRDVIVQIFRGATRVVGAEPRAADRLLRTAGERLWLRIDPALRHPLGHRLVPKILKVLEPSAGQIVTRLLAEPGLEPLHRPSPASLARLVAFAARVLPRVPLTLIDPKAATARLNTAVADYLAAAAQRSGAADDLPTPAARLAARLNAFEANLAEAFPTLIPRFGPVILPAMVLLGRLDALARRTDSGDGSLAQLGLAAVRGVAGNITTEMDLGLWDVARAIQLDATAAAAFGDAADPDVLAQAYLAQRLPPVAQRSIEHWMTAYGMRGVAEIDFGRPRWREQPTHLMATLISFVAIADPAQAPDAQFAAATAGAKVAVDRLAAASGRGRLVRFMASRVRATIGARETPKFTVVRVLGLARTGLLASGGDLVAAGLLSRADDIFFLHLEELRRVWSRPGEFWRNLVTERRTDDARERRRGQVPRMLTGDGRAFYEGLGAQTPDGALAGSPVSPGVATGRVRVVFDPHSTRLEPGEILVCPGTDPAWTPLFLAAGGLITEVGGMMTHGSVVAREYGIPAVVGVHDATGRLSTGQLIRLDGTTGTIAVLQE